MRRFLKSSSDFFFRQATNKKRSTDGGEVVGDPGSKKRRTSSQTRATSDVSEPNTVELENAGVSLTGTLHEVLNTCSGG